MTFATILVAIDINDPEHSRSALEAARSLKASQAAATKIHILYVRYYLPVRYAELLSGDFDTQEIEEARRRIHDWKIEYGLEDANFVTRRGAVRDEVFEEARRSGADLIIIGSHQPSLSSRMLGSNASAIVRNSPISVLIAREKAAA
nr:universal stress protein [Sphingobium sp. Ndbn-10]